MTLKKPSIIELEQKLALLEAERQRRISDDLDPSDCALSSWADSHTSALVRAQMELAKRDWMAWFPVLYQGAARVNAKQINGKYGLCWMVFPPGASQNGKALHFVGTGLRALAKHGYRQDYERSDAHAKLCAPEGSTGFTATIWVEIIRDADELGGGLLDLPAPKLPPKLAARSQRCPDCGARGERAGHQTCPYPQNH